MENEENTKIITKAVANAKNIVYQYAEDNNFSPSAISINMKDNGIDFEVHIDTNKVSEEHSEQIYKLLEEFGVELKQTLVDKGLLEDIDADEG